jgi:serine/threonine protein kinase
MLVDVALPSYSQPPHSCAHSSIATPRYMAPEALSALIDGLPLPAAQAQAADLWSLGIALWELAAQRMPYADAIQRADIYRAMAAPLQPSPGDLDPVLGRMLRLEPAERQTAADLLALLRANPVV